MERIDKEQYLLKKIEDARKELIDFYKTELIKCYSCGKKSQRQKWFLQTYTQTEAECGYPVSYITYFSYEIICPKCNRISRMGSVEPKHSHLFIKLETISKKK